MDIRRRKRIEGQSGLIEVWILFVSILMPVFIGYMVLMSNVIVAKNTVYYSKMVLNGSLYAASHAQDTVAMARGIKKLDVPKAKQIFTDTIELYRYAERDRNTKLAQNIEVSANNLIVLPPGQVSPRGYRTINDTLYIEGKIPFTIKLPFADVGIPMQPITISAWQKFVTVNYLEGTIY